MSDQLTDRARKAAEEIYAWPRHWPQEREYRIITDQERLSAYAAIIERHCRKDMPEPGTSVVRWARYDGTPETLPEENGEGETATVSVKPVDEGESYAAYFDHRVTGAWIALRFVDADREPEIGDLWAYLPEPPEGME